MFDILPLVIIIICLIIIISIVVKKFSALASLDVSSIPAEKEALFKERIMSNRLKRNFFKYYSKFSRLWLPLIDAISNFFKTLHARLIDFKENNKKESNLILDEESLMTKLFKEAENFAKDYKYQEAEKKYIEIIGRDNKSTKAFRYLGEVYVAMKNNQEAQQTFSHALRLLEKEIAEAEKRGEAGSGKAEENKHAMAEIYFDLAAIAKESDNYNKFIANIDQALSLVPKNPRYLDIKLEISIMNKDKKTAWEAYEVLETANPENQKLGEFKRQIEEL